MTEGGKNYKLDELIGYYLIYLTHNLSWKTKMYRAIFLTHKKSKIKKSKLGIDN